MRQGSRSRNILNIKEVKWLKAFKKVFQSLIYFLLLYKLFYISIFFIYKNISHLFNFQKNISSIQNHYYIFPLYAFIIHTYINFIFKYTSKYFFFSPTLVLGMENYDVIQQREGLKWFSLLTMFRQNSWTNWVMELNYIIWGAGLKTVILLYLLMKHNCIWIV